MYVDLDSLVIGIEEFFDETRGVKISLQIQLST